MKRMLVSFLLLTIFTAHYQTIFAAFHEEGPSVEEMLPRLEEIFQVRTSIWNSILDGHQYSLKEMENKLKDHIENPLLKEDLKIYQEMIKEPTSYEKIKRFVINECIWLEGNAKNLKMLVNIQWEVIDYGETYFESVNYILELGKKNDKWNLKDYRVFIEK